MKTLSAATLAALAAVTLIWATPAQETIEPAEDPLIPAPGATDRVDVAKWAKALRVAPLQ